MTKSQLGLFVFLLLITLSNSLKYLRLGHKTLSNDDIDAFREAELEKHNELRKLHGVPPLQLDDELNQYAQYWAKNLAQMGEMQHSSNDQYGENIYRIRYQPPRDYVNGVATKSWYNQISMYDFSNPQFDYHTGHFTQVVWKGSQKVGFGIASNSKGQDYVVAEYYPPGNYIGQFQQNVPQPLE